MNRVGGRSVPPYGCMEQGNAAMDTFVYWFLFRVIMIKPKRLLGKTCGFHTKMYTLLSGFV